jgi:hypothetical protein
MLQVSIAKKIKLEDKNRGVLITYLQHMIHSMFIFYSKTTYESTRER